MSSPCFCIKQGDNPFTALESSSVRGFFCFPSLNSTTNHGIPIMKRAASESSSWSRFWIRYSTPIPMAIVPASLPTMPWRSRANAAGNMIGLWSSIFAGYSTTSIISYSCGQYANTAKTDGSCSTSSDGSPLRCERLMAICVNGRAELLREGSSVLSLPISSRIS